MTFVKTRGGGLMETGAKQIPLDFTLDNLIVLLNEFIDGKNTSTYQDFADWARRYHMHCMEQIDTGNDIRSVQGIVSDIDARWDLNLFNTYTVEELLKLDLTKITFPKAWLENWRTKAILL